MWVNDEDAFYRAVGRKTFNLQKGLQSHLSITFHNKLSYKFHTKKFSTNSTPWHIESTLIRNMRNKSLMLVVAHW